MSKKKRPASETQILLLSIDDLNEAFTSNKPTIRKSETGIKILMGIQFLDAEDIPKLMKLRGLVHELIKDMRKQDEDEDEDDDLEDLEDLDDLDDDDDDDVEVDNDSQADEEFDY